MCRFTLRTVSKDSQAGRNRTVSKVCTAKQSETVFRLQLQARTLAFAAVAAQPHVKEPGGTRLRVVNPRFVADRVGKVVLEGRAEEALPVACRV